jgi:subtilisin family serine protease
MTGEAKGRPRKTTVRKKAKPTVPQPDFGPPNKVDFKPWFGRTKGAKRIDLAAEATDKARTAVHVHGIGNHPEEQILIARWDRALFGKDMGDRTRMAYWVNRARYPQPSSCDCIDPKCACHDPEESFRARRVLATGKPDPDRELREAVQAITSDPAQQAFLYEVGSEMLAEAKAEAAKETAARDSVGMRKGIYGVQSKGIGDALLRKLTDLITGMALPDVQDFLFEPEHRKQMEDIFLARLRSGGDPFVVIAHSQGSMIAYDVLRQLKKSDVDVRLFVTIGSPLGLPPVRSVFKKWTGKSKLPFPPCVSRWLNVAATGDVVALDPSLGDEIDTRGSVSFQDYLIDRKERDANPLFIANAHSSMGYLSTKLVQREVHDAVGREFSSSLGQQLITSDLVEHVEAEPDDFRHKVMIEVKEAISLGDSSIEHGRKIIDERLHDLAKLSKTNPEQLGILHHMRYVSADLNRMEIEVLRTEYKDLQVHRIWQNARKRALICRSAQMVQATPAQQAYAAHGHNIEWAVLDTGVHHLHPHFATHANFASLWDCTRSTRSRSAAISEPRGGFVETEKGKTVWPEGAASFIDRSGHGTHVAGIIAGQYPHRLMDDDEQLVFAGMAPKAKLHSFKVLDDRGQGEDAWILIALDKIARINEQSQGLRIHGINLSLGGNFDPSVYGCGHTPLCTELRRLWRQGVVIVLAAGNEGFAVLQTLGDGPWNANLDLSIGDPANLEEAIAVGSVHRVNPHTFGVSYFSSRGPTADGRQKPDLVAPGEKILSARADFEGRIGAKLKPGALTPKQLESLTAEQLYVAESGTSMAAPHVSGLIAAFLSQRREFIGYPDRVKKILLDNCTDLGRDTYAQGAGLPNLIKMLAGT